MFRGEPSERSRANVSSLSALVVARRCRASERLKNVGPIATGSDAYSPADHEPAARWVRDSSGLAQAGDTVI